MLVLIMLDNFVVIIKHYLFTYLSIQKSNRPWPLSDISPPHENEKNMDIS